MNRTLTHKLFLTIPVLASMMFASSLQAQSSSRVELPAPPQLSNNPIDAQTQPVTPLQSLQQQSNQIRQLLLSDYRNNDLFGQMIAANSKIRGTARRISENPDGVNLKEEGPKIELLIQDLEEMIEEANFRDSRSSNPEIATYLGRMIASLEDFKRSRTPAVGVPAAGSASKFESAPMPTDTNQELNGPDYPIMLSPYTEEPGSLVGGLPQQPLDLGPPTSGIQIVEESDPFVLPELDAPIPQGQEVLKPSIDFGQLEVLPVPSGVEAPRPGLEPALRAPSPLTPYAGPVADPSIANQLADQARAERRAQLLQRLQSLQVQVYSSGPSYRSGYVPYGGYGGGRSYNAGRSYYSRSYGGGYGRSRGSCPYGR